MDTDNLLKELQEVLQRDTPLDENMSISDIDEWDSLGIISVMAFLQDRFDSQISFEEINKFETIQDFLHRCK